MPRQARQPNQVKLTLPDILLRYQFNSAVKEKAECQIAEQEKRVITVESLTARENEILDQAARGLTIREIAEELYISPKTVENHLQNSYSKLGVSRLLPALLKTNKLVHPRKASARP